MSCFRSATSLIILLPKKQSKILIKGNNAAWQKVVVAICRQQKGNPLS
jgi:hypothetical protein